MAEQLPLILDAPAALPLSAYDREDVGRNAPLTAGEVAALAFHGYTIAETSERGVYLVTGQIDGSDGEMWSDALRCDLDLFYLCAKAALRRHPLEGLL